MGQRRLAAPLRRADKELAPISPTRSIAIAALAAPVAGFAMLPFGGTADAAASAFLGGTMAMVAFEDVRRFRVPDPALIIAALAGVGVTLIRGADAGLAPWTALAPALLSAALWGGGFLLIREGFYRLRERDGLGLGDVKLAAVGGLWLGWDGFAIAVLIAALAAFGLVALRIGIRGRWPGARRIPLAAFLAPAIWGMWFGLGLP